MDNKNIKILIAESRSLGRPVIKRDIACKETLFYLKRYQIFYDYPLWLEQLTDCLVLNVSFIEPLFPL